MNIFEEDDNTSTWDESESADPEADAEAAANDAAAVAAVLELTQGPQARALKPAEEPADEDYMQEAVRRLDVASYYREFTSNPLFENADENAAIVEREIRQFVNGRINALLGIKSDPRQLSGLPAKPLFDTNEVQVIKAIINTAPTLLGLSSAFAPRELEALKALAAVALRQKGLVPTQVPKTQDALKPRPVLRKAQAPVAVAAPKPQPTPTPTPALVAPPVQPQPTPRPVGRPALARRTSNRTAPATTATAAPTKPALALTKEVVHEVNGQEHVTIVPLIQKHPARVPFPASDRDFQAASDVFAANQARSSEANWSNEGKVSVGHR